MTLESESKITRKGMLVAVAGGAGALLLLATGKQAAAQNPPANSVALFDKNIDWINPATEDTLKLINTNTSGLLKASDLTFTKELGRIAIILAAGGAAIDPRDRNWTITETVPVSGSLGRTWTITETVPISHANLDAALSTLAKSSQLPSALVLGRLDVNVGATVNPSNLDIALSLIKAKTDNLDAALSTLATQATLALIKAKTDNLDVLLSTIPNVSDRAARLLGIIYGNLGQLDQRLVGTRNLGTGDLEAVAGTALTGRDWSTDFSKLDVALSTRLKIADYVITQELGRVGLILTAGGVIIDPRAIRTLTTTDSLEARPGNSTKTLAFAPMDAALSGDNTIVGADVSNKIKVTDYSIVCDAAVAARWKSGAATNLSGAMSFAANGGIMAAAGAGRWLFETAVNQALVLNLGGAVGARGHVTYFKEAS